MSLPVPLVNWPELPICAVLGWWYFQQIEGWGLVPKPRPGPVDTTRRATLVGTIQPHRELVPVPLDPERQCIAWHIYEKHFDGAEGRMYHTFVHTRQRPFLLERSDGGGLVWIRLNYAWWRDLETKREWIRVDDPEGGVALLDAVNVAFRERGAKRGDKYRDHPYPVGTNVQLTILEPGDEVVLSGEFEEIDESERPTIGYRGGESLKAYVVKSSGAPFGYRWLPSWFAPYRSAVLAKGRYPDIIRVGSSHFWATSGLLFLSMLFFVVIVFCISLPFRMWLVGEF